MNLLKEEQTDWNEIHEVVFKKKVIFITSCLFSSLLSYRLFVLKLPWQQQLF